MTTRYPEILGSSVVVLGAFNPAILTPDWLERNKLIGQDDADVARQDLSFVVSQQVTQFGTEWFALQVFENRFSLTNKGALTPALKDLAVGIFTLLAHTPVTAVGLNFTGHYKLDGENEYHKIGDVLAPKTIWKRIYPDDNQSSGLAELTILIQPCARGDKPKSADAKRITVQPSDRFRGHGVFFALNDHHIVDADDKEPVTAAERVAKIIDSEWQDRWQESLRVFSEIISFALEE